MTRMARPRGGLSSAAVAGIAALATIASLGPARGGDGKGSPLLWPLEVSGTLLSSFGEYRYDHLHAGIDISTAGVTGYKVFAAESGEIYRLKVEWRGYGRALYLRHPEGLTTVYGHLERYDEASLKLETAVAKRVADLKSRYPGDIYLNPPVPVRRGQLIAYSGESGVGLPHLHFEVRDQNDRPVDPFAAGLRIPPDHRPPVILSLTISVADPEAFIDGTLREKAYPFLFQGGSYRAKEPVRVDGPFLATIQAFDPAGGEGRSGLHAIEARLDGRLIYELVWRHFGFDQYPQAGLLFDHRSSHLGPASFGYRLNRLPGNDIASPIRPEVVSENTGQAPWAIRPSPGAHSLEIVARDEAGNRARATICLLVARSGPPLSATRDPSGSQSIRFSLADPGRPGPAAGGTHPPARSARSGGDSGCTIPSNRVEAEVWSGRSFDPVSCRADRGACDGRGDVSRPEPAPFRIREIRDGVPGRWSLIAQEGATAMPVMTPLLETWPLFLDLSVDLPRPEDAHLRLMSQDGRELARFSYRDALRWSSSLTCQEADRNAALAVASGEDHEGGPKPLMVTARCVDPGESAVALAGDLTVELPRGGRFFPGPLVIRREPLDPVPGLPSITDAAVVLPAGEALNAQATLTFKVGEAGVDTLPALGVYRWDPVTSRWNYEGGEIDPAARAISLRFRRYGRFALLRDDSPPVVTEVRPGDGARLGERHPQLTARVEEAGMGLNFDGVAFVLDGMPLESEFDPDRGQSKVLDPPLLTPGRHLLTVRATDKAGNVSAPVSSSIEIR
jgi:Peptidase family M23